jgi:hypothetical protein
MEFLNSWHYGILFRFILILAEPNLSQDFFIVLFGMGNYQNFINPYFSTE